MTLTVPSEVADLPLVVSVSGGKDSTALALALRESGIAVHSHAFADTGWEAPETYEYLDYLETIIGPIVRVRPARDMVASIMHRAGFPARMQRWCTRELKLVPLRAYHDTVGDDTVSVLGVRAEESEARSKMATLSDEPPGSRSWGGWVWRPLLDWTVSGVLEIHRRHGVKVNPLYQRGHNRVGCYPCIYASKEEIKLVADHSPERIDLIRSLESECIELRRSRNEERPGRYAHPDDAAFFQARGRVTQIDAVVEWSRTGRGGRQLMLLDPPPRGGCMRWGLCDLPGSVGGGS